MLNIRKNIEYRNEHKTEAIERSKQWRENNKGRKTRMDKHYSEQNNGYIKEYKSERSMCECGCELSRGNLSTHRKSKTHG